jgi:hypothetical protein
MTRLRVLYPHEYISGVARNDSYWNAEIYLVNRGGTEAMFKVLIMKALDPVYGNVEVFDSGHQIVPPGQYAFIQRRFTPADFGLYWCWIPTTSRDLVPSASFYRPSDGPAGTVPDFTFAPGDFDVFSPSSLHQPLELPIVTSLIAE